MTDNTRSQLERGLRPKVFMDTRNGDLVTQLPISQIAHYVEHEVHGLDGDRSIYTVAFDHEKSKYGRLTLDQLIEIDAATWDYFLGILPPMHWRCGDTAAGGFSESFLMSEASTDTATGVIRSQFLRRGTRYFHRYVEIPNAEDDALERDHY